MKRYNSRPYEVEAVQLTRHNWEEIALWCGGRPNQERRSSDTTLWNVTLEVPTLDGVVEAQVGEFVVKSPKGNFYILDLYDFQDKFLLKE